MRLRNYEIIQCLNAIAEMDETPMPVALTFKVNKVRRKLISSYEDYLRTLEPIKNDELKVQELLELETEVTAEKIKIEELMESGISISLKTIEGLSPVLEE